MHPFNKIERYVLDNIKSTDNKLRCKVRICEDRGKLTISAESYAESTNDDLRKLNNLWISGSEVKSYLDEIISDIKSDLNASVLLQIAPRVSIITKWNVWQTEIQFLNTNLTSIFGLFTDPDALNHLLSARYPGISMIVLIRHDESDELNESDRSSDMNTDNKISDIKESTPVHTDTVVINKPVSSEENKTSDDTIKDMLARSLQYAQAQTANLKEDTANQLTPTLKDVSSAAVDIKKIVDERNKERSPYRPEDNELQKLISRNKVPDSLNMPEILEVSEDTDQLNVNGPAQVEGTEDATEENLNELFSDSSED